MHEESIAVRARDEGRMWITRGHLAALAAATFFIALLAFFLGVRVGRSGTAPDGAEAPAPLLPDPAAEDALEVLLREVESAQKSDDLAFPDALAAGREPAPPTEVPHAENTAVALPIDAEAPEPPPDPSPEASGAPAPGGWAVQVASFEDASEADARIAELRAMEIPAYRVAAEVNGRTWYRARVGGFASKEAADAARLDLESRLGASGLILASEGP